MFVDTVPGTPTAGLAAPAAAAAPPACADRHGLKREVQRDLLLAAALLTPLAAGLGRLAGLGPCYAAKALAVLAVAGALLWRGLPAHRPHRHFGVANRVTLVRLLLVALLAAGLGEPLAQGVWLGWAVVALATAAALMDALDGPLARAGGLASDFGARFDMETDALLMLVLSLLAVQSGQAGAWVLACGGMRYVFVAAAAVRPWLAAPLPPSLRRKAVCVLQIVCLIASLAPLLAPPWSGAIAAAGLAALCYSFGVDVAWLARHRHPPPRETSA